MFTRHICSMLVASVLGSTAVLAEPADATKPDRATAPDKVVASDKAAAPSLIVYFNKGSSTLRPQDRAILDRASRAYNEGKPIVMVLTGMSDRVGNAQVNLTLSERRATAVLHGLLDRGIPAERFQVLAKGQTELAVPTNEGTAEEKNRRVEITWR